MEITSMIRQWIYNLTSFLFNWLIKVLSLWFYWVRFHPQWTHHAVFKGSLFLHLWQYGFRDWVDRVIYILGIWMLISGFSALLSLSHEIKWMFTEMTMTLESGRIHPGCSNSRFCSYTVLDFFGFCLTPPPTAPRDLWRDAWQGRSHVSGNIIFKGPKMSWVISKHTGRQHSPTHTTSLGSILDLPNRQQEKNAPSGQIRKLKPRISWLSPPTAFLSQVVSANLSLTIYFQ